MDTKTKTTIDLIRTRYGDKIEQIRSDRSRSEDYKRSAMAREYLQTKSRVDALVEKDRASTTSRRRDLESQVFGIRGLSGDQGSLAISRRDAGDRAAQLDNAGAALELLGRAERSGDEPLARAIAERAVEAGWAEVANAFLETRPSLDNALTEIWDAKAPTLVSEMAEAMESALVKPHEVSGVSDYKLAELASEGDSATALNSPELVSALGASLLSEQDIV